MTALRQIFEDFGEAGGPMAPRNSSERHSESDLEGQRLEAFENGYKAGWDDAIKAQSDDKTRISSAFGQHLQDLSFTYHEAFSQAVGAMNPLLDQIVNALLPAMARQSLGMHVAEQLKAMAREIGQVEVQVAVAPPNTGAVAEILAADFGFPIRLVEDPTLADEQADIRFGQIEKQIDLSDLLKSVTDAVEGFAHESQRKIANG